MCCLKYEHSFYLESFKKFPKVGAKYKKDSKEGIVKSVNIFTESIMVMYDDRTEECVSLEINRPCKKKKEF